jgi:GTP cyclohydrolase I
MRGAKMTARMVSSDVRGAFRDSDKVRQEFFHLAGTT